ncbi:L-histidine N(alpha)-methyltransferase [Compostibacter hankyongensis]|uniref:L-histidine N(Alpha)-methyltransferase n=1 Tax=Compostibacter hankyongensis TaxID=1007089 RepID=A0ABP8FQ38_9BACT
MNQFFRDVWQGLHATPKYLQSKYFYDEKGDKLFQQIMKSPEYYLTRCELEIFTTQAERISALICSNLKAFNIVELGAGDGFKSVHLLRKLREQKADFTYYPIDISKNIIMQLSKKLQKEMPGLEVCGLNGEYFAMLEKIKQQSGKNKVVLFLGSSIGNIPFEETASFLRELKARLLPGDLLLTGFDLKKDPAIILKAYNDDAGLTKAFNLNLLKRINDELDADFDPDRFEHCPVYDEQTGACKSFLKSTARQKVRIGEEGWIHFEKDERIFMEISQKYTAGQTDELAAEAGFKPLLHLFDSRKWFLDALWQ